MVCSQSVANPNKLAPAETSPPESATNFLLNLAAMAAGLAALFGLLHFSGPSPQFPLIPYAPALPCLSVAVVVAVGSWRRLTR